MIEVWLGYMFLLAIGVLANQWLDLYVKKNIEHLSVRETPTYLVINMLFVVILLFYFFLLTFVFSNYAKWKDIKPEISFGDTFFQINACILVFWAILFFRISTRLYYLKVLKTHTVRLVETRKMLILIFVPLILLSIAINQYGVYIIGDKLYIKELFQPMVIQPLDEKISFNYYDRKVDIEFDAKLNLENISSRFENSSIDSLRDHLKKINSNAKLNIRN